MDFFEYIEEFCTWLYDLFCSFFVWLWNTLCDFTYYLFETLLEYFPRFNVMDYLSVDDIYNVKTLLSTFSFFLPLEDMYTVTGFFFQAVIGYIVIRLLIKLIPTIG